MKHSIALSLFSTSLLTVLMRPSSSQASSTADGVDFELGVTTLVAEGGALPTAHLGLRVPIGSFADLELRLDTLGYVGALQTSFDLPVLRSESGLHSLALRATATIVYGADFYGSMLLIASPTAGLAASLGSKGIRAALSVEAGFAVAGALGGGPSTPDPQLDAFVLRPEVRVEFFAEEVVRPFLGASAFVNPDLLFGAATLGARW